MERNSSPNFIIFNFFNFLKLGLDILPLITKLIGRVKNKNKLTKWS